MQENIEIIVKGKTDPSLKAAEQSIENVGTAADNTTKSLDELVDAQGKAASTSSKVGKEASKSASGITSSGNAANKASSFFSKLGQSFKRIFLYRTIRKVISEIGQAAREGIGNLYDYSAALGSMDSTHAKTNMDSLATSALYVKNSIGAMLGPVIQAITPIVYQLADAFAVAANAVNQLFAALVGNSTFTKAVRFPTQMKKGLSGASAAAKELRRTLLGFDEVNRLDMETPSGGGGGASALDTSGMFEEAEVSKKFEKLAEILKRLKPLIIALGIAFAAWKIGELGKSLKGFISSLGKLGSVSGKVVGGLVLIAGGIALIIDGVKDMLKNGADIKNFGEIFAGVGVVALGVGLVFGSTVGLVTAAVGAIAASFAWCTQYIHDRGYTWSTWFKDLWETIKVETGRAWEWIKSKISGVWDSITDKFHTFANKLKTGWTNFTDGLKNGINTLLTPIRNIAQAIDNLFNTNFSAKFDVSGTNTAVTLAKTKIVNGLKQMTFASGGFPTTGELFIARENGIPEMVGQIGGQTAVANNDQIVTAIEQGVYRAMSSSGQNITLNVDGKSLFDIIVNRNNSQVRQTGKSPILV